MYHQLAELPWSRLSLGCYFSPVYKVQELNSIISRVPSYSEIQWVYMFDKIPRCGYTSLPKQRTIFQKEKLKPLWSSHPVFIWLKIRFWLNVIFSFHPSLEALVSFIIRRFFRSLNQWTTRTSMAWCASKTLVDLILLYFLFKNDSFNIFTVNIFTITKSSSIYTWHYNGL